MVARNEKIAKCVIQIHRATADHAEDVPDAEFADLLRHGLGDPHAGNSADG